MIDSFELTLAISMSALGNWKLAIETVMQYSLCGIHKLKSSVGSGSN